jgi:hypothetical protein
MAGFGQVLRAAGARLGNEAFCINAQRWSISQAVILAMDCRERFCLAKLTLVLALLLVAIGLVGYIGTGSLHPTALIPAWIGLALGICGFLAISPNERRRKLFMHINVTIALLGFLGSAAEIVRNVLAIRHGMHQVPTASGVVSFSPEFLIALESKVLLAALLFIYVILCVRSFIVARSSGKV